MQAQVLLPIVLAEQSVFRPCLSLPQLPLAPYCKSDSLPSWAWCNLSMDLPHISSLLLVLNSYQLPCPSPSHDNDGIEAFLPAVVFHPFADCISKHISFLSVWWLQQDGLYPWTLWTLAFSNFPGGASCLVSPEGSTLAMSSPVPSGPGRGKPCKCSSGRSRGNLELAVTR